MTVKLTLLGMPGAGKGTHGTYLADTYDVPHISTGDILRDNKDYETTTGETVGEIIDDGRLVSDETMRALLERELDRDGFVLDGYPRSRSQAETLNEIADIDTAVYLDIPVDEVYTRLLGRRSCPECGISYHEAYNPPETDGVCNVDGSQLARRDDDTEGGIRSRVASQWPRIRRTMTYYEAETDIPLTTVSTDRPIAASREAIEERVSAIVDGETV